MPLNNSKEDKVNQNENVLDRRIEMRQGCKLERAVNAKNQCDRLISTLALMILFVVVLVVQSAQSVFAQVPRRIAFQGALTDVQGKLQPNGEYQVTFSLFAAETGGDAVWSSPSKTVTVVNGLFNYIIGSDVGSPAFTSINLHRPLWLEIRLAGQALPSRFEITSGMYALAADSSRVSGIAGNGVPVGTIVAYYGECDTLGLVKAAPDGWMLCNGQSIPPGFEYEQMRTLASVAGHSGKLPDLRGMFLRGANLNRDTVNGDNDWRSRIAGSSIQKIGSVQTDALQGHWHNSVIYNWTQGSNEIGINGGGDRKTTYRNLPSTLVATDAVEALDNTGKSKGLGIPRISSETRPKNVGIQWLIRVKP